MNIFKTLFKFLTKFKTRLNKKKRDREAIARTENVSEQTTLEIDKKIEEKIHEIIANPIDFNKLNNELEVLIQTKTSIEIKECIPYISTKKQKIFSESELEEEILGLNSKQFNLEIKQSKIQQAQAFENQERELKVKRLSAFLTSKVNNITIQKPSNPFANQADSKFKKDFSLFEIYTIKEREKRRIEEIHKGQLKTRLTKLETLVIQNNLEDAKIEIDYLEKNLRITTFQNLKERFQRAKSKYEELCLKEYQRKQAEILRIQKEKAEKERLVQEAIKEQERIRQAQLTEQRRIENEIALQKEKELNSFLQKKSNWKEFENILLYNNITTFYHFTDKRNISSIIKNKGLYSWEFCDKAGIQIPFPGGDGLSRELDRKYRLQDFVRLSFCSDHPMQYRLYKEGKELILLRISTEVAYFQHTAFSDINATDSSHKHGSNVVDLQRINFDATKRNYVKKEDSDFKYHQAEILVKRWLPIEYITNINDFI